MPDRTATTRAIIIAAGRGARLEHHTEERPKCMVSIGGRTIMDIQLEALDANGVIDLHVVRGYLSEKLVVPGAVHYENTDWANNCILLSLFHARAAMHGPLLTTYSDIVYTADVVRTVLESPFDITLAVDRLWADAYLGRDDHPVAQAELAELDGNRVTRVGKQVGPERAAGEFIGLAGYSARGLEQLVDVFDDVRASLGDEDAFHNAQRFRQAYLTDLFEELIARNVHVGAAMIDGGWREIDTVEDLQRVNAEWPSA